MLVTDGADARLLKAFRKAAAAEGALVELIAPHIGGFIPSDGELIPTHQKIDGGPSVLYDAVVILVSAEGAALLAADATAKDFVTDAHAHCKFIAYTPDAVALLDAAGVVASSTTATSNSTDAPLSPRSSKPVGNVRYWARTPSPRPDLTANLTSKRGPAPTTSTRRTSIPRPTHRPRARRTPTPVHR